jgi:hypothetical protein
MLCVETQRGYISPSFGHDSRCVLTVMFQPTETKKSKFSITHYRISRSATVSRELVFIYICVSVRVWFSNFNFSHKIRTHSVMLLEGLWNSPTLPNPITYLYNLREWPGCFSRLSEYDVGWPIRGSTLSRAKRSFSSSLRRPKPTHPTFQFIIYAVLIRPWPWNDLWPPPGFWGSDWG